MAGDALSRPLVRKHVLGALVVRLAAVLEPASVFHGDGLTSRRAGSVAVLDGSLGNTHDDRSLSLTGVKELSRV